MEFKTLRIKKYLKKRLIFLTSVTKINENHNHESLIYQKHNQKQITLNFFVVFCKPKKREQRRYIRRKIKERAKHNNKLTLFNNLAKC